MPFVMQTWTASLPMMQQTVLLENTRGPDTIAKYHPSKFLLRWYRRCILISALDGEIISNPYDPRGGSFTGPAYQNRNVPHDWRPKMDLLVDSYLQTIDELPHHFALHFMHAVQILGYKHPNELTREWWHSVYMRLVNDMHLKPESVHDLNERLGDSRSDWIKHADKATVR